MTVAVLEGSDAVSAKDTVAANAAVPTAMRGSDVAAVLYNRGDRTAVVATRNTLLIFEIYVTTILLLLLLRRAIALLLE